MNKQQKIVSKIFKARVKQACKVFDIKDLNLNALMRDTKARYSKTGDNTDLYFRRSEETEWVIKANYRMFLKSGLYFEKMLENKRLYGINSFRKVNMSKWRKRARKRVGVRKSLHDM